MYFPLLVTLAVVSAANAAAPTVTLGKTVVTGKESPLLKTEFFGGIPYAKPPLGQLRLKPPVKTKLDTPTFNAENYGAFCLQPLAPDNPLAAAPMAEDCLYVNVFRPSGVKKGANLPVFFWTYGGGFQGGASNTYNASAIIAQSQARGTPIVFVSFNYRLGPLGFPQGNEAGKKKILNLALKDQIAALEWVQDNIESFGGDRRKVTVFGESAGAIMLAVQFLNPSFSRLARAAIFESGSAATPAEHTADARQIDWVNFVSGVPECASVANSSNTLDCLSTANTSSVLNGLVQSIAKADEQFAWDPTLDGPGGFLPERPSKLLARGQFARLPFIAGTNLDEGTAFVPQNANMDYGEATLKQLLIQNLSPPDVSVMTLSDTVTKLVELYPDVPALGSPFNTGNETFGLPQGYKRLAAIFGDVTFQSQRRIWQQTASNARVKTYGYLFTQPQTNAPPAFGVYHGSEVVYVFGGVTNPEDVKISRTMIDYWVSFVNGLDPNDGKGGSRPHWDEYTPKNQVLMQLRSDDTKLIPDNYREKQLSFINQNPMPFLHRRDNLQA